MDYCAECGQKVDITEPSKIQRVYCEACIGMLEALIMYDETRERGGLDAPNSEQGS